MRTAALPALVLLAGCTAGEKVRDATLTVLLEQQAAWNRGDIGEFMKGYRRSPETTYASRGGIVRGWDRLAVHYRERYPDRADMGELRFSDIEVMVLGRRAALVTGRWRLDRKEDEPTGVFSLLFVDGRDGWKIVHDHTSRM